MSFNRYQSYSVKARLIWMQKVLYQLGYDLLVTGKRDKPTIKSLAKFQEDNGLTGNAVICETTFNLLYNNGGSSISIKR